MSNTGHLVNVMVEAFIVVVESGVDLVSVVADSASTTKIAPSIKQFPSRLMNVGIAEQSMVDTAVVLALGDKVAVTCSTAPFLISWANEQIKVDVCYNNTNIKLSDLSAGAGYSPLASTHHVTDDLAIMRDFGNIQIFVPSTPRGRRQIIDYTLAYQGLVYTHLDGKALPELFDESYRLVPGAVLILCEGEDAALMAVGSAVREVVGAAQQLTDLGIQTRVVNVSSIRPYDTAVLLAVLRPCSSVIIVEEHNVDGGLGSLMAEALAEVGVSVALQQLEIPDEEYAAAADRDWMRQYHGFDATAIVTLVQKGDWWPERPPREARVLTTAMCKA